MPLNRNKEANTIPANRYINISHRITVRVIFISKVMKSMSYALSFS
jgi:hypothetical protein